MRFLPYQETSSIPNIIVDGTANEGTVLTLSHWRRSGTPEELIADTSAEIVFRYLDSPRHHVNADIVSNNHFDQDGLVGVFALIDSERALQHRDLLIDVAEAGDFGVFKDRAAARIAFTIAAFCDPKTSPLPARIFKLPYPQHAAELYRDLLNRLGDMLANLNSYSSLWQDEDAMLTESEGLLDSGIVTIEEHPELDLAVIRIPEDLAANEVHRFTQGQWAPCHPFAVHNRTRCSRLAYVQGNRLEFQYRYESWVRMATSRPKLRVDLAPLADELNREETAGGKWKFDGADRIAPRFYREGNSDSVLSPDSVMQRIERQLLDGPTAWNPYD
jgi:hypothetical protein